MDASQWALEGAKGAAAASAAFAFICLPKHKQLWELNGAEEVAKAAAASSVPPLGAAVKVLFDDKSY